MKLAEFSQSTAGRVLIAFAIFALGYCFPPWSILETGSRQVPAAASAPPAVTAASQPVR